MKYKVRELENRKIPSLDEEIDFSNKLNDEIVKLSKANVSGTYQYDKDFDMFKFYLHVNIEITSLSYVSLEPVKFLVDFDTELYYTFKVTDDDSFPIIGNEINLDEEIWGEIVLHMPSRVIKDDEEFVQDDEIEIEKENPFKALLKDEEEK